MSGLAYMAWRHGVMGIGWNVLYGNPCQFLKVCLQKGQWSLSANGPSNAQQEFLHIWIMFILRSEGFLTSFSVLNRDWSSWWRLPSSVVAMALAAAAVVLYSMQYENIWTSYIWCSRISCFLLLIYFCSFEALSMSVTWMGMQTWDKPWCNTIIVTVNQVLGLVVVNHCLQEMDYQTWKNNPKNVHLGHLDQLSIDWAQAQLPLGIWWVIYTRDISYCYPVQYIETTKTRPLPWLCTSWKWCQIANCSHWCWICHKSHLHGEQERQNSKGTCMAKGHQGTPSPKSSSECSTLASLLECRSEGSTLAFSLLETTHQMSQWWMLHCFTAHWKGWQNAWALQSCCSRPHCQHHWHPLLTKKRTMNEL